jgi:hypothetical protein
MGKFIVSEVFGSLFALMLSCIGDRNAFTFAESMGEGLGEMLGLPDFMVSILGKFFGCATFATWSTLYFYLIRDNLIRPIVRSVCSSKNKKCNFGQTILFFLKTMISLPPAISVGIINIALTIMNNQLSSFEKIIVAIGSVTQTTSLSYSGFISTFNKLEKQPPNRKVKDLTIKIEEKISSERNEKYLKSLQPAI